MKKPHKKIAIFVLAFIGIIAASFFIGSRSQNIMQQAAEKVSTVLSDTVHIKVSIGSLQVISPLQFKADGLTVYDKNNEEIAAADSVLINLKAAALFTGDIAGSIDEVKVEKPDIHITKREDGTWNYEDLLSNDNSQNNFKGKVQAESGTLNLTADGKKIELHDVNAVVDLAKPQISAQADFGLDDARLSASGIFDGTAKSLKIRADKLEIAKYLPLLPEGLLPQNTTISGGTLEDISASAQFDGSELTSLQGKADIKDGSCTVMGTKIDKITSQIIFNKDYLTVFAKASVKEQNFSLHGKIGLTSDPELALKAQSDALNPKNILKDAPFDGNISFLADITGKVSAPVITADLAAKDAQVYGYKLHNAKVKGSFEDNKLFIKNAAAQMGVGNITAVGTYGLDDKIYDIHADVKNLSCDLLQQYLPGLTGTISADAVLQGSSDDFDSIEGYATATLKNASYQGIAVDKAELSLKKKDKKIDLGALTLTFEGGGEASAAGTIEDRKLNLEFYGSNIDLGPLQAYLPIQLSGKAAFYGHLQGNTDNPYLQMELSAADGSALNQPYHNLRLSAVGNLDGVYIKKLTVKNTANEIVHEAHGIVGFKGSHIIDLIVDSRKARIENFISLLAPGCPLTGNVDNTVHLTGTFDDIVASGHILLYEGSYGGMLLTKAEGAYNYAGGNLSLQNFTVQSPFAALTLSGTMNSSNNLDFDVAIDDIDLAKMPAYLPYPISGKAGFRGHLSGTPDNPIFVSGLQAQTLNFNGEALNNVMGQLIYRDHVLSIENARWQQNQGKVSLQGRFNTSAGTMTGNLKAEQIDVKALAAMMNIKDDYFTGIFNGMINLGGSFISPSVQLTGTIADSYFKNYPLQNISLDAAYDDGTFVINKFYGEQNSGKVAMQGTWALHGAVNMIFSAQDIDAGLLAALADYNGNITGSMNAYAQISGSSDAPEANISFSIENGGMGGTTFDKMTGLLNLNKGIIDVNQILINKGAYKASATGKVPLAALYAKPWEMLTNYDQIDLNVSLDNADLNIVPLLTKHVDWAAGPLQGNLKINGSLAHPLFSGFIKMDNGAMKIKELAKPIENMKADIIFDREKMKINNFSGEIGGGTYSLTGETLLTGGGLHEYNFALNADKLGIDSAFYRGPLSAQFTLQESELFKHKIPKITGNIDIDKATISFPSIPDSDSSFLPEMLLDVGINLGNNVRLYKSMLYDMDISGSAHFGGTSSHPMPSGEITVDRGSIEYLHNIFKIREGSAYFNQVGPFLPSIIFKADTNLAMTKIKLSIEGPVGNMKFLLTSDPQMSQEEIIRLLTFRSSGRNGENTDSSDLTQLATIGLQMSFFNEVENFLRDTLRLDEFNIVSDTVYDNNARGRQSSEDVYNIEVGKYISDKVMLKYRNSINYDERRFSMQYDIGKNISLLNEWDNKDGYRVGLEANIKF